LINDVSRGAVSGLKSGGQLPRPPPPAPPSSAAKRSGGLAVRTQAVELARPTLMAVTPYETQTPPAVGYQGRLSWRGGAELELPIHELPVSLRGAELLKRLGRCA
jgi:hypothetical protein